MVALRRYWDTCVSGWLTTVATLVVVAGEGEGLRIGVVGSSEVRRVEWARRQGREVGNDDDHIVVVPPHTYTGGDYHVVMSVSAIGCFESSRR
jgi:hypothetical protein